MRTKLNLGAYLHSILRPEQAGQQALPRADLLVMTFAAIGGLLLVAADVVQRWILPYRHGLLDIDGHHNIETWFHTMFLALAGACAIGVAFTFFDNRRRTLWLVAGIALAFFSLDKATSLHEIVGAYEVSAFSLPDEAGSIAWEITWAPLILVATSALVLCVWEASATTKFWVGVAILGGLAKVGLEALTFPAIHVGLTTERGWLYGVEVNIEESFQLMGFSAVCAGFAQLLVERITALARGEVDGPESVEAFAPVAALSRWAPVRAVDRRLAETRIRAQAARNRPHA